MDKARVEEKITNLEEIIYYIKKLVDGEKKEILKNRLIMEALENNIRKAIQIMIDLATDLVTKNRLRSM